MDTGLTLRPSPSVAQTAPGRLESLPARDAVAPVLTPSQTVQQATYTEAARNDRDPARTPSFSHDVIIDPATREVIYRTLDVRSGQVISQLPSQMQLQIAAYTRAVQRALQQGKSLTEAQAKADLEI